MQIIFQDPYASLDPRTPIGASIGEGLRIHGLANAEERHDRVGRIMELVGPRRRTTPAAIRTSSAAASGSGSGSRAPWSSSRTCSCCDEPVSALDVSIQAQVLNLLREPAARARPDLPVHRPQHGRRRAHQRPGGGDVPRRDRGAGRVEARSTASRSIPTRSPSSRRSRSPSPKERERRRRIILLGDVPVAGEPAVRLPLPHALLAAARSSAIRSAASPIGRSCATCGAEHEVACHFAEELLPGDRREALIATAAQRSTAFATSDEEAVRTLGSATRRRGGVFDTGGPTAEDSHTRL